jgi:hypothetical protein
MDLNLIRQEQQSYRELAKNLHSITAKVLTFTSPAHIEEILLLAASTILRQSEALDALLTQIGE